MTRTLLAVALGTAAGAGATYLLMSGAERPLIVDLGDYTSSETGQPASARAPSPATAQEPSMAAARADLYARVAAASAAELESMIARVAAQEGSTERDFALSALLERYAGIDAPRAAAEAHEADLRGPLLAPIYAQWAALDPAGALEALRAVENPADAAAIGLALIDALGDDAAAIERVGAALLSGQEVQPNAMGLAGFVPFPVGVLGVASLAGGRPALAGVAASWAVRDAENALAIVDGIRDSTVRAVFEAAVLREWARTQPDAMLAHLMTLDSGAQQRVLFGGALGELARTQPERLLELARQFPPELRMQVEQISLQSLARHDPNAAVRLVERLPAGMQRQQLFASIAQSYAQRDPEGALAWARTRPPQQPSLVAAVLGSIAQIDPDHAFDLAAELTAPVERAQALQFVISATVMKSDADARRMADKILVLDDRSAQDNAWMMLLTTWSSRSPDDAMDWLLQNNGRAPTHVFQQIGQTLGYRDPDAAAAYTSRIPAEGRAEWIRGVASGYARSDPRAAVDWLSQFRGEPDYANNVREVAGMIAHQDGAAAARLFDEVAGELDSQQAMQTASMIANNWANRDPSAAAEWALDRPDQQSRSMAVSGVMSVWAHSDLASARQWTLRLPAGQLRDASLGTLLVTAATQNTPAPLDAGLLGAFSTEAAQQHALVQVVATVAHRDRAQARRIVDYYITDRTMRAQAEQMIENANRQSRQSPVFIDGSIR